MTPEAFIINTDYATLANDDAGSIVVNIPGGVPLPLGGGWTLFSGRKTIGRSGSAFTYSTLYSRAGVNVLTTEPAIKEFLTPYPSGQGYDIHISVFRDGADIVVYAYLVAPNSTTVVTTFAATITVKVRTFIPMI